MNIRTVQLTKKDLIALINATYEDDTFATIAAITEISNAGDAKQTITFSKNMDI